MGIQTRRIRTAAAVAVMALPAALPAQEKAEPLAYGNMDSWVVREIKESGVIGGHTKTLYELGPAQTVRGAEPYTNKGGSPWATSNVLAKVMGVTKTNTSVYREPRGAGYCARLETHIEKVRVLGLMNISVIAAGSLYLGSMAEPITGTKDGPKAQNCGVAFTRRPKALRFDYKTSMPGTPTRIKLTGFSGRSTVAGPDKAIVTLLLQRRTENSKGEITAQRVGTMVAAFDKSTAGWKDGATFEILYGDIRGDARYDARLMGLASASYALNSKGESVPVAETGWAPAGTQPTHLVLAFASSHGGAYVGTPGNMLWVDNVKLVY